MIAQPFAVDGGQRTTRMSKNSLSVGTLSAPHGQKRYGLNEFLVEGQPYRLPMWLINGVGEGPTLVVTAGIHAAEYASIAAALELGRSLDPASLSGRWPSVRVLFTSVLSTAKIRTAYFWESLRTTKGACCKRQSAQPMASFFSSSRR